MVRPRAVVRRAGLKVDAVRDGDGLVHRGPPCLKPGPRWPCPGEPTSATSRDHRSPRRRRVLIVIKGLDHGGAERLLVDVVAHRHKDLFDYEVAYVLESLNALVPNLEADGVIVHALGARGNGDLRWISAFRRLLVLGHYNLVHFQMPYTASLGRLVVFSLPRGRRPRLVQTEHVSSALALPFRGLSRVLMGREPV